MYKIRKKFRFEAAHVLSDSYSKECQRIHGHSYVVEIFISAEELNKDGMVIDFKKLKEAVKPVLDTWDHKLIVDINHFDVDLRKKFEGNLVYVTFNPTAENMCKFIFDEIISKLGILNQNLKVRVHETETGWAEYKMR